MVQTKTALVSITPENIVRVNIQPKVKQYLEDAKENLGTAKALLMGKKLPLLVDIREAEILDPEARHYYASAKLQEFVAFALLLNISPLGAMMGNVYLLVSHHDIPMKLFVDEAAAIQWLLELMA